jgi:hypothetical protein
MHTASDTVFSSVPQDIHKSLPMILLFVINPNLFFSLAGNGIFLNKAFSIQQAIFTKHCLQIICHLMNNSIETSWS